MQAEIARWFLGIWGVWAMNLVEHQFSLWEQEEKEESLEEFYYYCEQTASLVPLKDISAQMAVAFQISLKGGWFFWIQCLTTDGLALWVLGELESQDGSLGFHSQGQSGKEREIISVLCPSSMVPKGTQ